jgi:hypothetical protein
MSLEYKEKKHWRADRTTIKTWEHQVEESDCGQNYRIPFFGGCVYNPYSLIFCFSLSLLEI